MDNNNVFKAVLGLNLLQAVLRLIFAIVSLNGGMGQFLNTPITSTESDILFAIFAILGVAGLISVYLVSRGQTLGVMALGIVSVATIAFDLWGMTLQGTAAIGFVVPVITLVAIVLLRRAFLPEVQVRANEA
jgi:hypothetical protein